MLWNAPLFDSLVNTCLVCFGSAGFAVTLGLSMALLTACFRVPMRRFFSIGMLCLILVPVYVQATAWSAGFGVQGWFRTSQVAAAISPYRAIASVVWIHGAASAPICFLFCVLGLGRAMDFNTRQALLDFGPCYATVRILIPRTWPWIAAGALWTVATTGNDMVVTNLFQVPTVTESIYQQVQFNELRWASIGIACSFALLIGTLVAVGSLRFSHRLGDEGDRALSPSHFQAFAFRGASRWFGAVSACFILLLVVFVPVANLVIKAGLQARIEAGAITRHWSPQVLAQSIAHSTTFANEFAWSIQLSIYSTCLALILAGCSNLLGRGQWSNACWIGAMGFLLALPGPIVNLVVIRLLNRSDSEWLQFVADRTLIGPILAMQSRCLPIAFGIVWLAKVRFELGNAAVIQLDRGLPAISRFWIRAKALGGPYSVALVVCLFVAFADLSSYLLVQPPGVTTVAMRMFDLLHYGVKNPEAGLALFLASFGMVASFFCLRRIEIEP